MPPSGYSELQSQAIAQFLRSCSEALEEEGRAHGERPETALRRECADIDRALTEGGTGVLAECVLRLTREFYAAVAAQGPRDYVQFREHVGRALNRTSDEVLAVHIEPATV